MPALHDSQRGPEVMALRHRQGAVGSVVALVAFGDRIGGVCLSEEVVLSRVPFEQSPEGKGVAVGASRRQGRNVQGQGIGESGIMERIYCGSGGRFSAYSSGSHRALI